MKSTGCVVLLACLATAFQPAMGERELLSIRGVKLPAKGYVAGFKIDTWGVEVVAVCHFPPGWTITAGKSADPSGVLYGEGSLGVTWLDSQRLDQLSGLFLIEVEDFHEKTEALPNGGEIPATFKAKLTTGTYGNDPLDWHDIPISADLLVREPAQHCP